jgi:hypothetical protein
MAFDQPLEADRVEMSLFGAFIRAPIVGTLMWILGGDQAKEEERRRSMESDGEPTQSHSSLLQNQSRRPRKSALKKSSPSLAGSDISDIGSCSEVLDGMHLITPNRPLKHGKKELSWSDESGQSLVEIVGQDGTRAEKNDKVGSFVSSNRTLRAVLFSIVEPC